MNGKAYRVMIDTGASISCLPGLGDIMKHSRFKPEKANLLVQMANGSDDVIDKKVRIYFKPTGSRSEAKLITMYISDKHKDIFGFHALIGLPHLKLFDLQIDVRDEQIHIYHQGQLIGKETPLLKSTKAGIKVVDKFSSFDNNPNLQRILNMYKSVFTDLDAEPIKGKAMRIFTVHQRPIFAKQRHYSPDEIRAVKQHVDELVAKGIVEPSSSGYAANSRIIPKKNGSGRLVINYIPLNAVTHRDSYCLPHVSDIFQVIQGNRFFTTMDCAQGFYQIDVDYRDRHKTAFSTPIGNFQFRRCPFGARNSCAMFQAEMNRIFHDGLFTRCVVYVDDILIFGKTIEEHDENLEWVLQKCKEYHVKIKLEKCFFAQREVKYLGFVVSGKYIKPMEEKIQTLRASEVPRDKTELRSLIGKLNFYSRFIPQYSRKLEPLRILLTDKRDFQWNKHHQQAFEDLISPLNDVDDLLLVSKSQAKVLMLHILGDSLEGLLVTNNNRIITRASRLLSPTETNYSQIEKQLMALVFATNKFRLLLDPNNTTVKVPDNNLEKIMKLVNRPERVENLLLKMPAGFDCFKFEIDPTLKVNDANSKSCHVAEEIFYIDGACKGNGKPGCRASWAVCAEYNRELESCGLVDEDPSNQSAELTAAIKACKIAKKNGLNEITIITDSKYVYGSATNWLDKWANNEWKDHKNKPVTHVKLFKDLLYAKEGLSIEWLHVKGHGTNMGNIRADTLARSLLDTKAAVLNAIMSDGSELQVNNDETVSLKQRIQRHEVPNMTIIDDNVYYVDRRLPDSSQMRLYVPRVSRHWLLTLAHDDFMYGGHLGIKKTLRKLMKFYWPKMSQDVEDYVRSCDTCQKFKNPSGLPPGYLHSIPVSQVFEHLHLDIMGPLHSTFNGNIYIITATDAFSKWAFAQPYSRVRTSEIIKFLEEAILSIHGKPLKIVTDRGSQFTSDEWKTFMKKTGIEHKLTSPYHPQTNGIDERVNGTIIRILRAYVDEFQEDWDEHLKWSVHLYNTTPHESTGYSPYQVLHGMDPRSPLKPHVGRSDLPDIDMSRDKIRLDVFQRIRDSQEKQKRYYDRHRSPVKLYEGQLVYVKIHAPPSYLTKKFYIKWHGPCLIIKLLGENNNPKAVTILDYENMTKKTVAVQDVKPAVTSKVHSEESKTNEKGRHHTLIDSSAQEDFMYYSDFDPTPQGNDSIEPSSPIVAKDNTFDITRDIDVGPFCSSPKRVTINESANEHYYPKISEILPTNHNDVVPDNDCDNKELSDVVYNIDNIHEDPTYKPPKSIMKNTNNTPSTDTETTKFTLPTSTQPRYTLRSHTKQQQQLSQSEKDSTDHKVCGSPQDSTMVPTTSSNLTFDIMPDKGNTESLLLNMDDEDRNSNYSDCCEDSVELEAASISGQSLATMLHGHVTS